MEDDLQTGLIPIPEGAYFDEEGILYDKDGSKLPDGLYETPNGDKILYEGNFDSLIIPD